MRERRRAEIAAAFERTLARLGVGGATTAAVADEAGVAPGLLHHHFSGREDLVLELLRRLTGPDAVAAPPPREGRPAAREDAAPRREGAPDAAAVLAAYTDAALGLGPSADSVRARAWVGLLAEAIRSESVASELRRVARRELRRTQAWLQRAGHSEAEARRRAAGLLAQITGSLVVGALLPGEAEGFAAPFAKRGLGLAEPPSGRRTPTSSGG